jgi:DNA-binding transcriptional regulator LsrR (DeoR family)
VTHDDDLALAAVVAEKHYLGGLSKTEIGEQLFLSRFKVARLLDVAVERGIVKFTINLGGDTNADLADKVRAALRLKHVIVTDDGDASEPELFSTVGHSVVELLSEITNAGDVVGISSTRSLMGLSRIDVPLPRATFIQLNGALSRPDAMDIIDGIRKLTAASPGGRAHVFYAPLIAPDERMWRSYHEQPDARLAFSMFPQLAITITGIGAWRPGLSVTYDNIPKTVAAEAHADGAAYEILGVPIDTSGHTVHGAARRRVVAPDAELLHQVPLRVGIAVGDDKADAVAATIRAGLINCLVTHRRLAARLLE